MKFLNKIILSSLAFCFLTNSFADTNSLNGQQIYDYFNDFIHQKPNQEFLDDKDISYSEFFEYFYSSFQIETPRYTVNKMYKLVRQIDYRSIEAKQLFYSISNDLILIKNKNFDFNAPVTKEDLFRFRNFLFIEEFKQTPINATSHSVDFYENFLIDVYRTINSRFYYQEDLSKEKMVYGAINGMVDSLDDIHSSFQTPSEKQDFLDSLNQELEGIGASMMLNENKQFQVITPLKDSPAIKAGIKPGDIIVSVNGMDLSGKSLQEGIALIKGPKNTKVKLTIKRGTKFIDFYVTRAKIEIPLVSGSIIESKNLLVDIRSFGNETYTEVKEILENYNDSSIENIIIDLRSNPGGYLNSAILIADLFLENNEEIVSTIKSDGTLNSFYASNEQSINKNIYIIANQGTASASEILILALKEAKNAKVYGEKTYGKGSLQELINFSDDSALKLTIGLWLGPNNYSINKQGIRPDVEVATSADDILNDNDPVLNKILLDIK